MHSIPRELASRPFTSATASAAGVTRQALRGSRFRRVFRDVYVLASLSLTSALRLHAAMLVLPADAVASHTSAMELWGLGRPRRFTDLELSTNTAAVTKQKGIILHRRRGWLTRYVREGVPVTGPDRTFIDCSMRLSFVELIQLGNWLLHTKASTLDILTSYVHDRDLDGVRRARRAVAWVREGVESPRETLVRLMLVFARLPEPECNRDIYDAGGRFVARGDLRYARWEVLVEHDEQQHKKDPRQRQRDRERRERLEAQGWRVIVVTAEDLREPRSVPWRVYAALKTRGYEGPAPHLNDSWLQWFSQAHSM